MTISLKVNKSDVMGEVALATAYAGGKMSGDPEAFGRISVVDEDQKQLGRFWDECRAEAVQDLIGLVSGEAESGEGVYTLDLEVSNAFDEALLPSMEISLRNYFAQGIAARWYVYTNKGEAGAYAEKAALLLDDVKRKAYFKKKPARPAYGD